MRPVSRLREPGRWDQRATFPAFWEALRLHQPLMAMPYDNGRRGPCRILNGASGAAGLERPRSSRTAGRTGSTASSPRRSICVDHARMRPGGCGGARKEATPRPGPARQDRSLRAATPSRGARQVHAVTITRPRRRPRSAGGMDRRLGSRVDREGDTRRLNCSSSETRSWLSVGMCSSCQCVGILPIMKQPPQ